MAEKTAQFIKDVSEQFRGTARLYRMHPPLEGNPYVVVSAVDNSEMLRGTGIDIERLMLKTKETYIFGANENGTVRVFEALEGSYQGDTDIRQALANAGYEAKD